MLLSLTTQRLELGPLSEGDEAFILEMLNTPGWTRYIGDKNVYSKKDVALYIQEINNNPATHYYVARLKDEKTPIGIISYIQRYYLDHPDIGFALLPAFERKGYAHEAAFAVLSEIFERGHAKVLGLTLPQNVSSIKTLEKLGLRFDHTHEQENKKLSVFSLSDEEWQISQLTHKFFGVFNNTNGNIPDFKLLEQICIPGVRLINRTGSESIINDLDSFIPSRQKILSDGTLVDFWEKEISHSTTIIQNIAQRYSCYEKSGVRNGQFFKQAGHKFLQFVKTVGKWKISSVLWEDEEPQGG